MEIKLNFEEIKIVSREIENELGYVYKHNVKVFKEGDDYRKGLSIEDEPDLYNEAEKIINNCFKNLCEETIQEIYDELCIEYLKDKFRERIIDNYND